MAEQLNSKFGVGSQSQQSQQNNNSSNQDRSDSSQMNGGNTNGGSLNSSHQHSNESVDLDNLFAFLSEVQPSTCNNSSSSTTVIDEIGQQMNNLVEDLDIELESVIQQEIEGLAMERPSKMPPSKKG